MMTLDEAIEHAEWCAKESCGECAEEHRQLAEWLKELKQWQKLAEGIDLRPESLMKPLQPNVNDLERENAKLRDAVAVLWECCACNTDSFWCEGCDYHDEDNGGCKVEKVLHELGIEAS